MVLQMFRLKGKNALVTGSSRGLGSAIAIALAQAASDAFDVFDASAVWPKAAPIPPRFNKSRRLYVRHSFLLFISSSG
jgi:hypothetical protein